MKYLCLGYHDEKTLMAMSESERKALLEESRAYNEQLRRSGHYLDGKALQGAAAATTLRFEDGRVSVTNGSVTDTNEQLGGVMVLEARDLNQAIRLLSQLPGMRIGGSLEIRPISEERFITGDAT